MRAETPQPWWQDPDALITHANVLRETGDDPVPGAMEEALRSAFRRVAPDLEVIARRHEAKQPLELAEVLGTLFHEKIAAFLLLAKYTLLDLAHFPREVLDIETAHQNLALFAEVLFRARAVDGLFTLYDFSQAQSRTQNPRLWANVCSHCLMLLALLEDDRPRVIAFLARRPVARKQLNGLISLTRPEVVGQLLRASASRPAVEPEETPPAYLTLYERYDPGLPFASALGVCSSLIAQYRLVQALDREDLPTAIRWFIDGSPAAAREVLRHGRAVLPRRTYRHLLEAVLTSEAPNPVRRTAIVLELGALNREDRPEGGVGETNRLLFETAMTPKKELLGVAGVAVRELQAVRNLDALLVIAEQAPHLTVAEWAVEAMKDLRRLLMVEPLLKVRPKLENAYQIARQELVEIQKVMDAVWTCESNDEVQAHVQRLKALKAFPELETIAELAERKGDLNRLQLTRANELS